VQLSLDGSVAYAFGGWQDNRGLVQPSSDPVQVITANPAVTSYTATVTPNYRIQVRFTNTSSVVTNCSTAPGDPSLTGDASGLVYLGSTCLSGNADIWMPPGQLILNAFPYPGFVFAGWAVNGNAPSAFLTQIDVKGPLALTPWFIQSKRVQFITDPPGLKVLINRATVSTSASPILDKPNNLPADASPYCDPDYLRLPPTAPRTFPPLCYGEFDFLPNSTQVIGGLSPQYDQTGKYWVFSKWSNGMADNAIYNVGPAGPRTVLVAQYKPGVSVSLMTSPPGLRLSVNGRENWPSYNFMFAAGTEQKISAIQTQTDRRGRRWVFKRWSNGGAAEQVLRIPEDSNGIALTAVFDVLPQATLETNPPGMALQVDGQTCVSPCVLDRDPGTEISVSVPERIGLGDDTRLDFAGWSDGAGTSRKVAFNVDSQRLVVSYEYSYRLALSSDPPNGVKFKVEPRTADLFYPAETAVSVTADAAPGFKFRRWGGDLSGTYNQGTLQMSSARGAIALMDKVPFIPPAGVRNAAGETPDPAVAPGSLIAIYGENLAPEFQVGRTNPLAQTIGGVTVKVADRYLPLLFVSPKQVNAFVPSDLPEGEYELTVSRGGEPDVKGKFTVAKYGPGLFGQETENGTVAVAFHEDGSAIASDNPVRANETITFYATGLGPTERRWIDGFDVPTSPEFKLTDPIEVRAEDYVLPTIWAGLAPNMTGTFLIKVKIPEGLPPGALLNVKAVIGEKSSNLVKVPIQ
jgi:uncharacterized protein (TIGR03437 family)